MKFSEPLLLKPSRNLTMSLAGKSAEKREGVTSLKQCLPPTDAPGVDADGVTFSFDEQDGGVSVGGSFHLPDQRLFLFVFFFFRLQTRTHNFNFNKNNHVNILHIKLRKRRQQLSDSLQYNFNIMCNIIFFNTVCNTTFSILLNFIPYTDYIPYFT